MTAAEFVTSFSSAEQEQVLRMICDFLVENGQVNYQSTSIAAASTSDAELDNKGGDNAIERRIDDDFRNFEARNLKRHPRSAVRFLEAGTAIFVECDCVFFKGKLRLDPASGQTVVHHPDCETGLPAISTLDIFAEKAAAHLLRRRRQQRDVSLESHTRPSTHAPRRGRH